MVQSWVAIFWALESADFYLEGMNDAIQKNFTDWGFNHVVSGLIVDDSQCLGR